MRFRILFIFVVSLFCVSCSNDKNEQKRPFMRTVDDNPPHTFYRNDISVPEEMRNPGPEFEIVKDEKEYNEE